MKDLFRIDVTAYRFEMELKDRSYGYLKFSLHLGTLIKGLSTWLRLHPLSLIVKSLIQCPWLVKFTFSIFEDEWSSSGLLGEAPEVGLVSDIASGTVLDIDDIIIIFVE